MALTKKQEKKIIDGKFYLAKYIVRAFMCRWEPVEAYKREGEIYFLITGSKNHLYVEEIIDFVDEPIKLPEEIPRPYNTNLK